MYLFKKRILVVVLLFLAVTIQSQANIVGTDIQNFNPTTSGLDFVTVHSSETLEPGLLNFGLYFNYSGNTLAYTRSLTNQVAGEKPGDRILGMDMNFGLGLTENWDFGFSFPAVLSQELSETTGVAKFSSQGFTEIRFNTKYKLWGNDKQGIAAVFSVNRSLIENNPFSGQNAGPTFNYELVADMTLAEKFGIAVNVGYRKRNKGELITTYPYEPMQDQWIYSIAGNYLISSIDTKLIAEIFASDPVKKVNYADNRNQTTVESLVGLKHDYSPSLALHSGIGSQIQKSAASPEWRIYIGLNYVFGPLWKAKEAMVANRVTNVDLPKQESKRSKYRIRGEILFDFNSAVLKQDAFETLNNMASELLKNSFTLLTIEGHTDSIGNDEYNLKLSQDRAESVKLYLINVGKIDKDKVKAIGMGETIPIADNGNYQGRKENRRVEFIIE